MKMIFLAAVMLLSFVSVFAQEKNGKTYPEEGTVVESPAHDVYIVQTATTRFRIFGHPTLELNEVIHFRVDKGLKPFAVWKNGKENHYFLNGQEPVHKPDSSESTYHIPPSPFTSHHLPPLGL